MRNLLCENLWQEILPEYAPDAILGVDIVARVAVVSLGYEPKLVPMGFVEYPHGRWTEAWRCQHSLQAGSLRGEVCGGEGQSAYRADRQFAAASKAGDGERQNPSFGW